MSWECGECSRDDDGDGRVDAVCHHCGLLVCREHQYLVWDTALGGPSRVSGAWAVHCRSCRRAHHRRSIAVVDVFR